MCTNSKRGKELRSQSDLACTVVNIPEFIVFRQNSKTVISITKFRDVGHLTD